MRSYQKFLYEFRKWSQTPPRLWPVWGPTLTTSSGPTPSWARYSLCRSARTASSRWQRVDLNLLFPFRQSEDLFSVVETYEGKELKLYVYNTDTDNCREVVVTPNCDWGGDGRRVWFILLLSPRERFLVFFQSKKTSVYARPFTKALCSPLHYVEQCGSYTSVPVPLLLDIYPIKQDFNNKSLVLAGQHNFPS